MSGIRDSIKILHYLFSPFKKMLILYLIGVIIISGIEVFRISLVYPLINYGSGVENQLKLLDAFYNFVLPSSLDPFISSARLLFLVTIFIAVLSGVIAYAEAFLFSSMRDPWIVVFLKKLVVMPFKIRRLNSISNSVS